VWYVQAAQTIEPELLSWCRQRVDRLRTDEDAPAAGGGGDAPMSDDDADGWLTSYLSTAEVAHPHGSKSGRGCASLPKRVLVERPTVRARDARCGSSTSCCIAVLQWYSITVACSAPCHSG
jgi:hypothetical protein